MAFRLKFDLSENANKLQVILKYNKIMMSIRKCVECGKEFVPVVHNQKYCTSTCRDNNYATSKIKTETVCTECGKLFNPSVYNQKYCTDICKKSGYESKKLSEVVEMYGAIKKLILKSNILKVEYENDAFTINLSENDKILDDLIRKNEIISPKARAELLNKIFWPWMQ